MTEHDYQSEVYWRVNNTLVHKHIQAMDNCGQYVHRTVHNRLMDFVTHSPGMINVNLILVIEVTIPELSERVPLFMRYIKSVLNPESGRLIHYFEEGEQA